MNEYQILVAFDLATVVGCCDGRIGGEPRLFSWYLDDAGPGRPARLHHLAEFLNRYFQKEPCDGVVYEAPMPVGMIGEPARQRIMLSEANVALARGLIGVLEERCYAHGLQVAPVPVQAARVSVLGWRTNRGGGRVVAKRDGSTRDETTKERVLREVRLLGPTPDNDNEADAYVLWRYACNRENPRLAIASTPLFRE